jgi:hypothetical protein
MTDESHENTDDTRAVERGALSEIADANEDATWGDTDAGKAWVPGVISGDLGPKGKVSAQLRHTARAERSQYGEVPYGAIAPGTGRYLLVAIGAVVLVLVAIVALIFWLAA